MSDSYLPESQAKDLPSDLVSKASAERCLSAYPCASWRRSSPLPELHYLLQSGTACDSDRILIAGDSRVDVSEPDVVRGRQWTGISCRDPKETRDF